MLDIKQEKFVEKTPYQISIKGMENILRQMKNCICKIYNKNEIATGFFCKIPLKNDLLPVLITNHHVINIDEYIKNNKNVIEFSIYNRKYKKQKIKIDNSRKIYSNEKRDITIIEIKPKDRINFYLELDDDPNNQILESKFEDKPVYIIHYPRKGLSVSYGKIKGVIKQEQIKHYCSTQPGSSGSPILSLTTFKIIGIHCGAVNNSDFNYGAFIKYKINEFHYINSNLKDTSKKWNSPKISCFYKNIKIWNNNNSNINNVPYENNNIHSQMNNDMNNTNMNNNNYINYTNNNNINNNNNNINYENNNYMNNNNMNYNNMNNNNINFTNNNYMNNNNMNNNYMNNNNMNNNNINNNNINSNNINYTNNNYMTNNTINNNNINYTNNNYMTNNNINFINNNYMNNNNNNNMNNNNMNNNNINYANNNYMNNNNMNNNNINKKKYKICKT